jgi:hypothetical protein
VSLLGRSDEDPLHFSVGALLSMYLTVPASRVPKREMHKPKDILFAASFTEDRKWLNFR